jgi:hypothetical protein
MSRIRNPNFCFCLWEFELPEKKHRAGKWKLVEAYLANDDGYPLLPPKNCPNDKHGWERWTRDTKQPISRAVTIWSMEYGVRLLGINPSQRDSWLSVEFFEQLKQSKDWVRILEDGHSLLFETARQAYKLLFPERKSDGYEDYII